ARKILLSSRPERSGQPKPMITDPSMRPWLWVPAFARTTGREKRRGLCTTTLLRLRRPDAGRAGTELDRSGRLELLAVEVEHHDLFLDHALNQKRSVVLAPGETLHQWPVFASVSGTNSLPLTLSTFTKP